jgi:hypothetical protein
MMGVYMTSFMAYFTAVITAMGIYMTAISSYFTAFFIIMFG